MERGLPIENYGKKEQKEWLDKTVTVPDPRPCTAGNKEEEHISEHRVVYGKKKFFLATRNWYTISRRDIII